MHVYSGYHFQRPVNDWPRAAAILPPGTWIKAIDNVQMLDEAKRSNSGLKTVLRHFDGGWQRFDFASHAERRGHARLFLLSFVDGTFLNYAHNVDAIEELNEYNASSHSAGDVQQRVDWVRAVSEEWALIRQSDTRLAHIRLVVGNVPIGNDLPLEAARLVQQYGNIAGYHPYVPTRGGVIRPDEWRWYSGRWTEMDARFRAAGITVDWLFTEAGPIGYTGDHLGPNDGWRHPDVCNGSVSQLLAVCKYWMDRATAWNYTHDGRALGQVLYNSGGASNEWRLFEIAQPEMDTIAAFNRDYVAPPPPPDPEPEPEPEPIPMDWKREVIEESERRTAATGIRYNPAFAYIRWMVDNGYAPANSEGSFVTSDGVRRQLQGAIDLRGDMEQVTLVYEGGWGGMSKVEVLPHSYLDEVPEPFAFRAWPTDYKVITQIAGNNTAYYGQIAPSFAGHEGLDIRAPLGAPVYSVDAGVVSDLRTAGDAGHAYGRFVRVRHSDGYESTYGHLQSISVQLGQAVSAGQEIGQADNTGNIVSGSSHLHLTLKKDGVIVDPTPFALPHKPDFPGLPPASHGVTVCDVSSNQGAIDFRKMLRRGVHGAYIRGSIGGSGLDVRFATNWHNIGQTSLQRGMYHLFRSDSTARQNMDNIKRKVDEYGEGHWRVAIDVEPVINPSIPRVNGDRVRQLIDLFTAEMGYSPIVYTGNWVISGRTDGDTSWASTSLLWLAEYWNFAPQSGLFPRLPIGATMDKLLMHQFTSSLFHGSGFGVSSIGLDVNAAYNLERLRT